jgi:uncharacterized protein with GYD domain
MRQAVEAGIMAGRRGWSPPSGAAGERRKTRMPTYVSLINWTDQGIRTVRDTLNRRGQTEELAEKHGVKIEQVYWTVGPYDVVIVLEADDESATAMLLELSSAGNLKTLTLRAYDNEEMSGIIRRLG